MPVYNVEKYLEKCLKSISLQLYDDYEVIIICDKSNDNSEKIVDKYVSKNSNFYKIYEEKTGLGKARNIGVSKAKGDYILFLDGDDYIEEHLLENLDKEINDNGNLDIIRFQVQTVENDNVINKYNEKEFDIMNGISAFDKIFRFHFIEPSWAYCYNIKFWKKNSFQFLENCIAEDFGLTPYIIYKAEKVKIISYIGYNYVQRDNSLMNDSDYNKKKDKMKDIIYQANRLYKMIPYGDETKLFYLFISNSILTYMTSLKYSDYKKALKKINKNKLFECFPEDCLKDRVRKMLFKLNPYVYKKVLEKFL